IVLALVGISAILILPAAYALWALRQVHDIAQTLDARDVEATDAYGDLRDALESAADGQTRFVALHQLGDVTEGSAADTTAARARVDSASVRIGQAFGRLQAAHYGDATPRAEALWRRLSLQIAQERAIVAAGGDTPDALRRDIAGGFGRMEQEVVPIGRAIQDRTGREALRAERVASGAVNTTLTSLAVALLLAVILGTWLTRTLLRPVGELRRGMGTVAEGDLDPHLRIPVERPDELGDLARSFRTMTARLRELDRLKAEFVSVASHEIKTPLSVIRGYVTLLADGIYGPVSDKQRTTLEAVNSQADRLTRLVHRLLDVSRFEAGGGRLELREIDLREFFDELTSGFQVLAMQNGIEFPVRLAGDLPATLTGDEDRLNEVLGNLLSNSFKFTPRGGTIRVEAERCPDGICIEVEDSGVGIPADKLPRIFEKFYQVDNDAQPRSVGSGLGLAISREIVEAHGGTISAESQEGRGTRFRVVLPQRPPASRAA
ncbi:MAG TPA: HAMP domain-containing sensor histidine kinase, partial [Longimicrobium sp.]|uniref:sensor histidine kinase n=1 Tax=Longimicrobium sp. TaxID=2029185 RepID=UPI002ED893B6